MTRTLTGDSASGSIVLGDPDATDPPAPTNQFLTPESTGTTPPETTAPPETTVPTEPPIDTSPNVLELDFDSLIEATDKKKLKEVHKYFASRTPSNKNEKTGMFEGSNLILITAEAFSHLAVSEELTPTLYRLMHEGSTSPTTTSPTGVSAPPTVNTPT